MSDKDSLYQTTTEAVRDFVFDDRVVRVFPDMINRSVPGYGLIVPMMGLLARRYAQDDSVLYDLGCSLGAVTQAMSQSVSAKNTHIVAVDNSPAMIERLNASLATHSGNGAVPIRAFCEDLQDTPINNASVVVLNFTLQFLAPDARPPLLQKIAEGLLPGGVLLLSEKICFEAPEEQALQAQWHHDFKRAQGYSELEIARKREALENVLRPESLSVHRQRLLDSGFTAVYPWFQAFNFVSLIALR